MSAQQDISQRHAPVLLVVLQPEGGVEEEVDLSDRIISFEYTDDEKKADKLSMQVDNFDGSAWDEATYKKGNIMRIQWGYPGYLSPAREVVITKANGGTTMTVEAKAKSILMARETKTRTFENMTRSEVVAQIAEENGFGSEVQDIEATAERFETIVQPNVSDARFLKNLAFKEGFEFYVDHEGMHWRSRGFDKAPVRRYTWYGGEVRDLHSIHNYNVENDLTAKPAKTVYRGIDSKTGKPFSATGSNAETKRPVLQEIVEIRDVETGEWKQETRAAVQEEKPSSESSEASAKKRADGRFRKISQRSVTLSITVTGDPLTLAKTVNEVLGIAKRIDGRYYIEEVKHSIGSGYTCAVKMITDGSRGHVGVSVNEALFAPSKSSKGGASDPYGVSLTMINVIGQAIAELLVSGSAAGLPVDSLISTLEGVDATLTGDPANKAAYERASKVGQQIKGAGLRAVGSALISAARRGKSAADAAKAKGELNTQPLDEDPRALQSVVRDSETQEWVPK